MHGTGTIYSTGQKMLKYQAVAVRSRYARSSLAVGVLFTYGVGTVPLRFGTLTFLSGTAYREIIKSLSCRGTRIYPL